MGKDSRFNKLSSITAESVVNAKQLSQLVDNGARDYLIRKALGERDLLQRGIDPGEFGGARLFGGISKGGAGIPESGLPLDQELELHRIRANLINDVADAITPTFETLKSLDPNIKIGIRGSLARGFRGSHKLDPKKMKHKYFFYLVKTHESSWEN